MRRHGSWALTAPSALFFLACFVAPTIYLLLASFGRMQSYALTLEFNIQNYVEVFAGYWDSLLFTFAMAFLIACCTTVIAFVFAYGTRFVFPRWSAALLGLILLTLFGGYLSKVYAWKTILGSTGVINSALATLGLTGEPIHMFLYNPVAVVIALTHYLLPLAVLPLYGSLRSIRNEGLEAASDLGAGRWRGFRDIVLPQCKTGLIVSFTLTFLFTAGDYVTARLVGGPNTSMMGVFVQNQFGSRFNPALGAAMSFTLIGLSALVIVVVSLTINRVLRTR